MPFCADSGADADVSEQVVVARRSEQYTGNQMLGQVGEGGVGES
jgi:hypothetical protein